MKQTPKTVLFNGYGSNERESRAMEQKLNSQYDADCVDFCSALNHPAQSATMMMGKLCLDHSAGFMALARAVEYSEATMLPQEVIAVAPPLRRNSLGLARDAVVIARHSAEEARRNAGMRGEIAAQTAGLAQHVVRHPRHHATVIHQIARFNSLEFAATLAARDIPISLVFMDKDEFFNLNKQSQMGVIGLEAAIRAGVHVHELPGGHVDFTHRPLEILEAVRGNIGRISLDQALNRQATESPVLSPALALA